MNTTTLCLRSACALALLLAAAGLSSRARAAPEVSAEPAADAPAAPEANAEVSAEPATETPTAPVSAKASRFDPGAAVLAATRGHEASRPRPWSHELVAGLLTGALVVPGSALLAGAVGRGPGNLLAAALPATLLYLALPPLAVTFAAYAVGRYLRDDHIGWSPALWLALGVQVIGFALTALGGFSTGRANDLVAITAFHALALGAVVTFTLPWGRKHAKGADLSVARPELTP